MAGHNKWSKIKHKKAATDAHKSKVFSKYARLITVESKKASGNTSSPSLRAAIEKARAANMPKDNIDRAVAKGKTGTAHTLVEVIYEAYGPGGVALIITGLTDNRNRTAAEIKHLLSQHSLELAAPGSAAWAFTKGASGWSPRSTVEISEADGDRLASVARALEEHDDVHNVFVNAV